MSLVDLYADLDMSARLMALEKEHEGAVLMLLKLGKLTPVRIGKDMRVYTTLTCDQRYKNRFTVDIKT